MSHKTTKEERIALLRKDAAELRSKADVLIAQGYALEARAYEIAGELAKAEFHYALARGDGQRGYIRLRAKQLIARGEHYEGDSSETRAEIEAEVERLRSEGQSERSDGAERCDECEALRQAEIEREDAA